jgi:hypothetical protein
MASAPSTMLDGSVSDAAERRKDIVAIVGASAGNLVEWYDFYAYAFTSIYFAPAFFPATDPTSQHVSPGHPECRSRQSAAGALRGRAACGRKRKDGFWARDPESCHWLGLNPKDLFRTVAMGPS